jgi:hypothetical protein
MLATLISMLATVPKLFGHRPWQKTDLLWIALLLVFVIWAFTSKDRGQ